VQPLVEGNGVGKKRGVGVGGFLLALVTAGALTHVAVRMKGIEVAYALGRERRVAAELEEQRRRLQIEIGMLKDPGRVVSLARDKLKMGPPAAGDIVHAGPNVLMAMAASPATAAPARPPVTSSGQGKATRPATPRPARAMASRVPATRASATAPAALTPPTGPPPPAPEPSEGE